MNETSVKYSAEDMEKWAKRVYLSCGLGDDDAAKVAHVQTAADLRGVLTHGTMRCRAYVGKLKQNGIDPRAKAEIIRDKKAVLLVDGNNAMGQLSSCEAMELAIERAEQYGCATVALRGGNHAGMAAYYALMAAKRNMIGICVVQGGGNVMAPWGGTDRMLGNNPVAIAIPAKKHYPVVLDLAMSVVSGGKVDIYRMEKREMPEGWAYDAEGNATTDPERWNTLVPIGGYKGYGLSFVNGLLSAALAGCPWLFEQGELLKSGPNAMNVGMLCMAIDVGALQDKETFLSRVDDAVDCVKNSAKRPGIAEIYVPGEQGFRREREYLDNGIDYPLSVAEDVAALSAELGIEPPVPMK